MAFVLYGAKHKVFNGKKPNISIFNVRTCVLQQKMNLYAFVICDILWQFYCKTNVFVKKELVLPGARVELGILGILGNPSSLQMKWFQKGWPRVCPFLTNHDLSCLSHWHLLFNNSNLVDLLTVCDIFVINHWLL